MAQLLLVSTTDMTVFCHQVPDKDLGDLYVETSTFWLASHALGCLGSDSGTFQSLRMFKHLLILDIHLL